MLADDHLNKFSAALPVVRLSRGGLATSSVTVRRWRHAGKAVHHIIDPRTRRPAEGPWRTVSVAAASCVDANAASTAALVAGADAEQWLSSTGLPSRLVGHDGAVVLIGGWPAGHSREVRVPAFTVCRRNELDSLGGAGGSPLPVGRFWVGLERRSLNFVSPTKGGVMNPTASHLLWYLSRGSGLLLLVVMSSVVILGVAVHFRAGHLRAGPGNWPRFALAEIHRALSLLAVALLGLHVLTAIIDPYVTIGWAASVVPFASPYRPFWVGLGAVALDLGGAVLLTSLLRHRLGFRAWKGVHWLAYLAWPAAVVHSVGSGNDLRVGWVAATVGACVAAVGMATGARLFAVAQRISHAAGGGKNGPAAPEVCCEDA